MLAKGGAVSDRLGHLQAFIHAADAGSFAAAAERLNLSRSAVGKSIARLEERLGTRLFHRTTRSQSLTEEGRLLYERTAPALAELLAAEDTVRRDGGVPRGRLRISVPAAFGRRCVAPVLAGLAARHPHLCLEVSFTDRRVDLVEEGFDLALRNGRLQDRSGLVARSLGRYAVLICAAPTYLMQRGVPATPGELGAHEILAYGTAGWPCGSSRGHRTELRLASRIRFDDLEAILAAALAGTGIACLPVWMIAEHLQDGRLVQLLPAMTTAGNECHLIWPHAPHMPSRLRVVADELVARIPPLLRGRGA
jgi:DNA-binding transcriptional LysR family regulator